MEKQYTNRRRSMLEKNTYKILLEYKMCRKNRPSRYIQ